MENFLERELIPYRDKVYDYLESSDFKNIVAQYQSEFFLKNYFDVLLRFCRGGKCVRAYLVSLGYLMCKGAWNDKVFLPSVAYEVFEAGILAHDDIIDRSPVRRAHPSMYEDLGGEHIGVSRAICVGDFALLLANSLVEISEFPKEIILKSIKHQNRVFAITISGELKDIDLSYSDKYSEEDIIEMYRLKTAWYTVIGPLILGGILADADDKVLQCYKRVGEYMGIAFQIKDDIMGIMGNEEEIGKTVLSDAKEGKKTILTSFFDSHALFSEKKEFYTYYGTEDLTPEKEQRIKHLLSKSGAVQYAYNCMNQYYEKACCCIRKSSISPDMQELFCEFAQYIINRKK